MSWFLLFIAGLFECVWAIGLKYSAGFTRLWPSLITLLAMGISFALLAHVMKTLPVGTAYAVWTGLGAAGVAVMGMVLFDEPANIMRLLCLGLIVVGVAGLKIFAA